MRFFGQNESWPPVHPCCHLKEVAYVLTAENPNRCHKGQKVPKMLHHHERGQDAAPSSSLQEQPTVGVKGWKRFCHGEV